MVQSHHSEGEGSVKDGAWASLSREARVNGARTLPNGTYANGFSATLPEASRELAVGSPSFAGQLPPEIEHITMGYISMSGLITRLVQETFNGLAEVINYMADLTVPQPTQNGSVNNTVHQTNGVYNGETSQANVQKKLRMFDFANRRRAQFIKILVLARWARQAEAIGRVIDLRNWLGNQAREYNNAISWMGELKRKSAHIKDPNPDIKTALEVLSLGKASWLPELGFLILSSQYLIESLRRINALLSIRLNLHDIIPIMLRDYTIASGRATFRVAGEFEVDLSIADEDPFSQLFFIDFRFIFTPAPKELPSGRLRDELEARANELLKLEGLQGLYEFLHSLVLTHKISVLRFQAYEIAWGYWADHVKIEPVHRSLVVQYWSNRPEGKSWIEIGLRRGEEARLIPSGDGQRTSYIALRWFRNGKEINDAQFQLKLEEISLVDILKQAIAKHTSYLFREIATKLRRALLYSGASLKLYTTNSEIEPMDASLLVQLTASKAIKIISEPVSGRLAVLPASKLNSRAEFELNSLASPAMDGSSKILHLRSVASQEEVDAAAYRVGWDLDRSLNFSQEVLKRFFSEGTQKVSVYRSSNWITNWALAFTTSIEGDFWWIIELSEGSNKTNSSFALGLSIRSAYKVASATSNQFIPEASSSTLAQIERDAAGMISQYVDARHLAALHIPHKVQSQSTAAAESPMASIYLRYPSNQIPPLLRPTHPPTIPWANEIVKLDYLGLDSSAFSAVRIASARMGRASMDSKDITGTIPSIAFHPKSGAFAFQLVTKVGESSIPALTQRLSALERLLDYISTIKKYKLWFNMASLTHLGFTYAQNPSQLTANIQFPADAPMHLSLSLPNPHSRILDHLSVRFRSQGLVPVLAMFRVTMPLLDALESLEKSHKNGDINVLTRSDEWYQIRYSRPSLRGGFDVCLRQRNQQPKWLIPESSIKKAEIVGDEDEWARSVKSVTRGKGMAWRGMHGGIVVNLEAIHEVMTKLDTIFKRTEHVADSTRPSKRKADGNVVEID